MKPDMEIAVVTGDKLRKSLDGDCIPEIASFFLDGSFEAVLKGEAAKQILGENVSDQQTLEAAIAKNVESYLSGGADDEKNSRELTVLLVGASCLQLFVQNNWMGPPSTIALSSFLPPSFSDEKVVQESALTYLSEDGEPTYSLSRFAVCLQIARVIFLDCKKHITSLQTWEWWLARCMMVQQSLLEQKSPTLRSIILEALEQISKKEALIHDDSNRDVAVMFYIEASRMCEFYWQNKMARDHVTQARKLAGLNIELTGAMGKRTRYQQDNKAQLVIKVTRTQEERTLVPLGFCNPEYSAPVPKGLNLDDDTVLDTINFEDDESNIVTRLSPLEQVLLYALMENHRRGMAQERLTDEEIMTYLEFIISQASNWPLSVSALTMRSKMQKDSRRRVERSMQQFEELINQVERPEPGPAVRLHLFYAAQPQTVWDIQAQLSVVLLSLGCTGAALAIYERLELWEDAIACYQKMGKKEKAESVIREQLVIKETPSLLCFLGDVTRDKTHYERAWELSNHRSARAMRCLAYIHFGEEKFEEAVDCFEKSLAVNSLQIPVWFTCGCACMAARKYESAVRSFKRCVNIDYDNFEAWNNLATAYARLEKRRMAYLTIKDALKYSYENWKLWENCLLFATNCGEFGDAIHAYNRLLTLKDKWSDTEVLGILVKAVVTDMEDAGGNPSRRYLPKMLEIFGQITAKVTGNAETWKLYADLCAIELPNHTPDIEKVTQLLRKSHRCLTQSPNWERFPDDCEKVAKQSLELVAAYNSCMEHMNDSKKTAEMLNSLKFSLRDVVSRIKQQHTDPVSNELPETLKTMCGSLDKELETIMDKLKEPCGS